MTACRCSALAARLASRATALELDATHLRQQLSDLPSDASAGLRAAKTAAKNLALGIAHELRDALRDTGLDQEPAA